jgi:Uma2 family endonuclease
MATTVPGHEAVAGTDADIGLPLILRLRPVVDLSDDQLLALCEINGDLRIERNAEGNLLIMPPTGYETGDGDAEITMQLRIWAKRDGTGNALGSSTGFRLPNGAMRAPDAAWILYTRVAQVPADERRKFLPLCPDFVIELRSPTDRLRDLHAKMREYIENGARLGWLIDPGRRHVYVYRPNASVERLDDPDTISGDPLLPGFTLDLRQIW